MCSGGTKWREDHGRKKCALAVQQGTTRVWWGWLGGDVGVESTFLVREFRAGGWVLLLLAMGWESADRSAGGADKFRRMVLGSAGGVEKIFC